MESAKELSTEKLNLKVSVHSGLNWNLQVRFLWREENWRTRKKTS